MPAAEAPAALPAPARGKTPATPTLTANITP